MTTRTSRWGWWAGAAAVAAVVTGLVAATPATGTATGNGEVHATYVGSWHGYVIGPDVVAAAVERQAGVRTAPYGRVDFEPVDGTVTIVVEDHGAVGGTAPVTPYGRLVPATLYQWGPDGIDWTATRDLCLPNGEPFTVTGVNPHLEASLELWSAAGAWAGHTPYGTFCRWNATAGTVTIRP